MAAASAYLTDLYNNIVLEPTTPRAPYHRIANQENVASSIAGMLREHPKKMHHIYRRVEQSVSSIRDMNSSAEPAGLQSTIEALPQTAVMYALAAYAFAYVNHFTELSYPNRGRGTQRITEVLLAPLSTAFLMLHYGVTKIDPRWGSAIAASHLIEMELSEERVDRNTAIRYLSDAHRHATLMCMNMDVHRLVSESTLAPNDGSIRNLIRLTDDELRASVQQDRRPLIFFRGIVERNMGTPLPDASTKL